MRRYWMRIALGALAVFAAGMIVISMVDRGKERVRTAIAQMPRVMATVPETLDSLLVDGEAVGDLTRLHITTAPDGERHMALTLAVSDSVAERLAGCEALHGSMEGLFEDGLACGMPTEGDYEQFGDLSLAAAGVTAVGSSASVTLPMYAPAAEVLEFHADAAGEPTEVDIRADSGSETRVRITDKPGNERVQIVADSTGARIEIKDAQGRPVFQLDADSTGIRMNAKDSQ